MELEKMKLTSASGSELNLEALYQIMPSAFTEVRDEKTGKIAHKINFSTLRELLGDNAYDEADEAALAGILDCRFGGPHDYFGEVFYKPYIGTNERILTLRDARCAVSINRRVEVISVLLVALSLLLM